jgi:uncharacterized lipoprotein YajG
MKAVTLIIAVVVLASCEQPNVELSSEQKQACDSLAIIQQKIDSLKATR